MPQYKLSKKGGKTLALHIPKQYQSKDRLRNNKLEME